jgi:hypothetical protein
MLVQGDVKCLHCGFVSGKWLGENGAPVTAKGYSPGRPIDFIDDSNSIRCARCEGPVVLDDATPVISSRRIRRIRRLRAQLAAMDAGRQDAA